jgi:hypothetical protein
VKICKVSPVSPNPRLVANHAQFYPKAAGDITGDIVFIQVIYHRLRLDKFTLKFTSPGIPVIPGILYILLYNNIYYVIILAITK